MFKVWLLKGAKSSIFTLHWFKTSQNAPFHKLVVILSLLWELLYKVVKVPLLSGVMGAGPEEKLSGVGVGFFRAAV